MLSLTIGACMLIAWCVASVVFFSRDRRSVIRYMFLAGRPVYGFEMIKADVSSRGYLYVVLARLEDEGLVKSVAEGGRTRPPGRVYMLTALGAHVACEEHDRELLKR